MMTSQTVGAPNQTPVVTLRARLNELRARGGALTLQQAVGVVVPVATEVAEYHRVGHAIYLHPSCLFEEGGLYHMNHEFAQTPPTDPSDLACMAPEVLKGAPGSSRTSVYAVGAMLYELVTGASAGRNMRRPRELVPNLPEALEVILSKALVGDPAHRPDDLGALAQALHQLAPTAAAAPPPADTSHLDHAEGFEVDVSLSMLPPAPGTYGYDVGVRDAPTSSARDQQHQELAQLKAQVESDPTPRFVVVRDGMDHGPFVGVELLQQIANHTFEPHDVVRDTKDGSEIAIQDSALFSHFAKHAKIHREIKAEKAAIERVAVQETRSTRGKAVIGAAIVFGLLGLGGVWFLTQVGAKSDELDVKGEVAANVETDAGLEVKKGGQGGGSRRGIVGRQGKYPTLGGGMSCEAAQAAYVEEMNVGGPKGQADLTAGQYSAVLNRGSYFAGCGVPDSMKLHICAAVQNGRAVGVSVSTTPRNARVQSCVARGVRGLSFPSHPKLDVTRTTF